MKNLLIVTIAATLVGGSSVAYVSLHRQPEQRSEHAAAAVQLSCPDVAPAHTVNTPEDHAIGVDYADGVKTITELKAVSDLIVYACAAAQVQVSEYAVQTTMEVYQTRKGDSVGTISVNQMGSIGASGVLKPGQAYLLFLGKQTDDEPETYFIKGGMQGLAQLYPDGLAFRDPIMQQDYATRFIADASSKPSSDFDSWLSE